MIFLKEVTRVVSDSKSDFRGLGSACSGHVSVDRAQWVCSKEP
jgi:hypothetical protein